MNRVRLIDTMTQTPLGEAVLENTTASELVQRFRADRVRLEPVQDASPEASKEAPARQRGKRKRSQQTTGA